MEMGFKKKNSEDLCWVHLDKRKTGKQKMNKSLRPRIDLTENQQHMTLKIMCTALINELPEQNGGTEKSFNQPNVLVSQRGLIRGWIFWIFLPALIRLMGL